VREVDILIIGGGITGAGCLLEAVRAGFSTILVEKNDFSSGTSSRSSRLIHGGIRYLESLQFGLVHEALKERYWIGETFPHLVRPLSIMLPLYRGGTRSPLLAAVGVTLYDFLAGQKNIGKSSIHLGKSAKRYLDGIRTKDLKGLCIFPDYQILMPERLVLEHILAAGKAGGDAFNYTEVTEISPSKESYITRTRSRNGKGPMEIRSDLIINAGGPWIDSIRKIAGFRGSLIRPTKGVHLEVPRLSDEALFMEAGSDGRLFFILPILGHTLVGATDTDYTGSPDDVTPGKEDVDYLISNLNSILTERKLSPADIYSAYSGLRPLINVQKKEESDVPRKHRIVCEGIGKRFISITGGKLTTFRKMAEDTVREAARKSGKRVGVEGGNPLFPSGTPDEKEEKEFPRYLAEEFSIPLETALVIFSLYGMAGEKVLLHAGSDPFLRSPLSLPTKEVPAQILYAFEKEKAHTLEDVALRRMLLGKTASKGKEEGKLFRKILTGYLGHTKEESDEMIKEWEGTLNRDYMVK